MALRLLKRSAIARHERSPVPSLPVNSIGIFGIRSKLLPQLRPVHFRGKEAPCRGVGMGVGVCEMFWFSFMPVTPMVSWCPNRVRSSLTWPGSALPGPVRLSLHWACRGMYIYYDVSTLHMNCCYIAMFLRRWMDTPALLRYTTMSQSDSTTRGL